MKQELKVRILYASSGVMMFFAAYAAVWFGLYLRVDTTGPYSTIHPFFNLGNLFLAASLAAMISGILLLGKKLFLLSIACIFFTFACGVSSAPIFAYLGYLFQSGLLVGSPLIALSAVSLTLALLGKRKERKKILY